MKPCVSRRVGSRFCSNFAGRVGSHLRHFKLFAGWVIGWLRSAYPKQEKQGEQGAFHFFFYYDEIEQGTEKTGTPGFVLQSANKQRLASPFKLKTRATHAIIYSGNLGYTFFDNIVP